MGIGDSFHSERTVIRDPRTDREYWNVTSWHDADCVATYCNCQAFGVDDRFVVFVSDRTGCFELYRLELESGETVQLADHSAGAPPDIIRLSLWPYTVHPGGREVVFKDGNEIVAIDLLTLERRVVARAEDQGWERLSWSPSFGNGGNRVLFGFEHADGRTGVAAADFAGSQAQPLYLHDDPSQRVGYVYAGTTEEVVTSFGLHPDGQDDPTNTPERRARAWRLNVDGSVEPLLCVPPGFRATHEHWGQDGRMYFHKKTVGSFTPVCIASVDASGNDYREHYRSEDRRLGHATISNDCRWSVTDVSDPAGNELVLVGLASGTGLDLCWPNTNVGARNHQFCHAHPSFNPSADKVVFTSDVSGKAAVYVVPLG